MVSDRLFVPEAKGLETKGVAEGTRQSEAMTRAGLKNAPEDATGKIVKLPQGLRPLFFGLFSARLKLCPDVDKK